MQHVDEVVNSQLMQKRYTGKVAKLQKGRVSQCFALLSSLSPLHSLATIITSSYTSHHRHLYTPHYHHLTPPRVACTVFLTLFVVYSNIAWTTVVQASAYHNLIRGGGANTYVLCLRFSSLMTP